MQSRTAFAKNNTPSLVTLTTTTLFRRTKGSLGSVMTAIALRFRLGLVCPVAAVPVLHLHLAVTLVSLAVKVAAILGLVRRRLLCS